MAKLIFQIEFSVEGDEAIALTGLEAQLPGTRYNFGKALATVSKLTKLPGPKAKSDALGLRKASGMID